MVHNQHKAELIKLIKDLGGKYSVYRVFEDFLQMSAISISNCIDRNAEQKEKREQRYLEIIRSYDEAEQKIFPQMLSELVMALETAGRPTDVLGSVFHELELHNKYKGQFFTPQHICDFMGKIVDDSESLINKKGYISVYEPCVGSGALVLGFANSMNEDGFNYQRQCIVTAIDIDIKCCHMAYLQFSLFGIPAIVIHGNSISMEEWSRWYTPQFVIGGWMWRRRNESNIEDASDAAPKKENDYNIREENILTRMTESGQLEFMIF